MKAIKLSIANLPILPGIKECKNNFHDFFIYKQMGIALLQSPFAIFN